MIKFEFILKHIWQLLFLIAVIVIFFMDTCNEPIVKEHNNYITNTVYDTITYHDTVYKPIVRYKYIVKRDSVIDTVFVIKDYFTKYFYSDVILNDSNGFIRVMDTLYQNRIISRKTSMKLTPTTIYVTKKINAELHNHFYIGGGVGGSLNSFGIDGCIMFINKKNRAYELSYDIINKEVRVGVMFKIH